MIIGFGILFPDFKITVYGWLAWLSFIISTVIGSFMIYCCVFGGSMSMESEGLIPTFKRWRKEREHKDRLWFEWYTGKKSGGKK
jgi:hypothetical protein